MDVQSKSERERRIAMLNVNAACNEARAASMRALAELYKTIPPGTRVNVYRELSATVVALCGDDFSDIAVTFDDPILARERGIGIQQSSGMSTVPISSLSIA